MNRVARWLWAGAACLGVTGTSQGQVSFRVVPTPAQPSVSSLYGSASDLTTMVGTYLPTGGGFLSPGRWTHTGEFFAVPTLPSARGGTARGVSNDGQVIVGYSTFHGSQHYSAWRWTPETGTQALPMGEGFEYSHANAVSRDGAVIGGYRRPTPTSGPREAVLWTPEGIVAIPFAIPSLSSTTLAVNADGSAATGRYDSPDSGVTAFRWTQERGVDYILPPPGWGAMIGGKISDDGTTVAGQAWNAANNAYHVFRWTESGGVQVLGDAAHLADVWAISGDGTALVGGHRPVSPTAQRPFYWSESTGLVDVFDILIAGGIDLTGWELHMASGIASDNVTIAGVGTFTDAAGNRSRHIWTATVPAPGSAVLLLGLALLPGRRRRR